MKKLELHYIHTDGKGLWLAEIMIDDVSYGFISINDSETWGRISDRILRHKQSADREVT